MEGAPDDEGEAFENPLRQSVKGASAPQDGDGQSQPEVPDPSDSEARIRCRRLAASRYTEGSVLLAAFANSIMLAVDSPAFPPEYVRELWIAEVVITVFFSLECAVKLFGFGAIQGPDAYFRQHINRLDFVVVGRRQAGSKL